MNGGVSEAKSVQAVPVGFIRLETARRGLALVWLFLGLGILVLVVLQSLLGVYQDRVGDVWDWFLPTIMPTLSLVVAFLASVATASFSGALVRKSFFYIAALLSALYLLLLVTSIVTLPFSAATLDVKIESLRASNRWLGPFQGVVAAALGVFFTSKQAAGSTNES